MLKTEDIRVRDPYIVAHEGKYYLYSSTVINDKMSDRAVYVYVSRDCRTWEEPKAIFTLPDDFWADCQLWASEVHLYRGKWEHLDTPIYDKNGGHAMFFDDFDGTRKMCIHCPERTPDERAQLLTVEEDGDTYQVI